MFLSFGNGLTKYKTRWVKVNVLLVLCCVVFFGQFVGMLMQVSSEIQSLTFSTADRPTWSLADLFIIFFCLCCMRVPLCVCCECSGADSSKTISAALNFSRNQSINQVIKFHLYSPGSRRQSASEGFTLDTAASVLKPPNQVRKNLKKHFTGKKKKPQTATEEGSLSLGWADTQRLKTEYSCALSRTHPDRAMLAKPDQ